MAKNGMEEKGNKIDLNKKRVERGLPSINKKVATKTLDEFAAGVVQETQVDPRADLDRKTKLLRQEMENDAKRLPDSTLQVALIHAATHPNSLPPELLLEYAREYQRRKNRPKN